MDLRRVRKIVQKPYTQGPVLYWMNRDMRIADNWALYYALLFAETKNVPIHIVYNLDPTFLGGNERQCAFKIEGLKQVEKEAQKIGIPFHVVYGENTIDDIQKFIEQNEIGVLVTDFSPLKIQVKWLEDLSQSVSIPVFQVDTHNIVPVWVASEKQEFGAYTLRPKIRRLLPEFLTEFPIYPEISHSASTPISWDYIEELCGSVKNTLTWIFPGENHAYAAAENFVENQLPTYHEKRNNPTLHGTSQLSPYLHYGMLSPQRLALMVQNSTAPTEAKDGFLEEMIVRRELADNFCFYNPHYDTPVGFPNWAKISLEEHKDDKREYDYTKEQFEQGLTHDPLWNAAQMQMVKTGHMHGYMRMYWAKKIFEWSKTVEKAMEIAIELNDRYQLDGRDPNGYVGIAWSMGGVHDRAWFERPVYGKIRYMNANGCKSKFDVDAYIRMIEALS